MNTSGFSGCLCILATALHVFIGCANYGLVDKLESPGGVGNTGSASSGFDLTHTIFITAAAFNGNLGGVAGADALCASNAANLFGAANGSWKALIAAGGQRIACTTSNCSGSGLAEHIDWVLMPNTTYYRIDRTIIGVTNAYGLFVGSLTNSVGTASTVVFTGLTSDWTLAGDTCNSWVDASSYNGQTGQANLTNQLWYANNAISCAGASKALYCVQQ